MKPPTELPKLPDKNKKYPAMSNAVCFKYEPGRGRYAIGKYKINRDSYNALRLLISGCLILK